METATSITIKDPTCVSIRVDETAEEILQDGEVVQVIETPPTPPREERTLPYRKHTEEGEYSI